MSHILRQSTQVIVRIGCFMDSVDGVTPETAVTLGAADQAEALKAAGAATADISGNTWAAITGAGGWYDLTLTTTDTNTVGDLTIVVQDTSVCLPVFARFQVVEEAVYDQLYAASAPGAATTTALATAQTDLDDIQTRLPAPLTTGTSDSGTTTTMVDAALTQADTDYWKGSLIRFTSGTITGQTRLITAFTPGTDTITFAPATTQAVGTQTYEILPAGAVDVRLWNGTAPNNLVSGRVDADVGNMQAGVVTAAAIAADAITAAKVASDVTTELRALVSGTADSGTTLTMVDAARTEADSDYWRGDTILFTSGNIAGQARLITAFNPATDTITFSPATTQAVSTQTYEILPSQNLIPDIRVQIDAGLQDLRLNELIKDPLTAGLPASNSFADLIMNKDVGQTFARSTDSLEAISEAIAALPTGSAPTAADNADAVWDELRAGHVIAGSFGQGVASVQGNVTGSVASVTGNVGGNVTGSVGSVAAGGITAASIATDAIDADALAASALAEINAEVDTALADIRLDEVIQNAASPITPTIDSFWDRITSKNGSQTFDRATDSLEAIADSGSTPPSAATIADAVWDELRAGHVGAGSFGEGVASVQGNVTGSVASVTGNVGGNVVGNVNGTVASVVGNVGGNVVGNVNGSVASVAANGITATSLDATASSEIADQVWEEAIADHSGTVGSTAEALAAAAVGGSAPTVAQIADGVWDEILAGHLGVGSTGEALDSAASGGAGLTAQQVRDAMKLSPTAGAPAAGSVDEHLDDILADTAVIEPLVSANLDATISSRGTADPGDAMDLVASALDSASLDATAVQEIVDGILNEPNAAHLIAGSVGKNINDAAAGGGGLTQQQVADSLLLAPAGVPAAGSVYSEFDVLMGPGFNSATDSMEEIRDQIDNCCAVTGGVDEINIEGI